MKTSLKVFLYQSVAPPHHDHSQPVRDDNLNDMVH
jgi:hypothetical protein